jgi:putative intracellular protease/amidase
MAGVGKSSIVAELAARGYKAVDLDEAGYSEYSKDGEWVWCEDRVAVLLDVEDADVLLLSGCAGTRSSSIRNSTRSSCLARQRK